MKPLFGYGTFRNAAWRNAILGAEYPCCPAVLEGWCRIALPSGYLSVDDTDCAAAQVDGVLIDLDDAGWRIADAWEEVPTYMRVAVDVRAGAQYITAQTYVCADRHGALPFGDDGRFALLNDAQVEPRSPRSVDACARLAGDADA